MTIYWCNKCGCFLDDESIDYKVTFRETRLEPEEREHFHDVCNEPFDDLEEVEFSNERDLVEFLNDNKVIM